MNLYKIIDETKKIINPLHLKFNNEKKKKSDRNSFFLRITNRVVNE